MKPNRNSSAGTNADSTTTADDMQVSQTIAKPNVVGSFNWSSVSDNEEVIRLIKQREQIEAQIRVIDEMALVKYELEALRVY